jgi:hypothetical protein
MNDRSNNATMADDLIFGARAIGEFFGMTEKKARRKIDAGALPTFHIGGEICARRSTLAEFIKQRERDAHPANAA